MSLLSPSGCIVHREIKAVNSLMVYDTHNSFASIIFFNLLQTIDDSITVFDLVFSVPYIHTHTHTSNCEPNRQKEEIKKKHYYWITNLWQFLAFLAIPRSSLGHVQNLNINHVNYMEKQAWIVAVVLLCTNDRRVWDSVHFD